jgi:hypothetical protein
MLCPRIFIYSAILTYRYCFCFWCSCTYVHSSVAAVSAPGGDPPVAIKLLFVPAPDDLCRLAVFKPVGFVVQDVPSYSSVAAVGDGVAPPKAKAAVCVPAAF